MKRKSFILVWVIEDFLLSLRNGKTGKATWVPRHGTREVMAGLVIQGDYAMISPERHGYPNNHTLLYIYG